MQQAIVIGAGISGIASAIRMAVKGFRVSVIEQSGKAGGKINEFRKDGFRFDMGPSLFTMPGFVDELFRLAGREPAEHFRYIKLENVTRYFYEDGTVINGYADPERFAREIDLKTPENEQNVLRYLEKSKTLYDVTGSVFINKSLHRLPNYFSPDFFRVYMNIHRLNAFRSMHRENTRWFRDTRVLRLFDRFATYNGSNPYLAPATLNVIPHLEHNIGAYFPARGMYNIVESLQKLATDLGVEFRFGAGVDELVIRNNSVGGVRFGGNTIDADVVISSIDVYPFYKYILPDKKKITRLEKQPRSTSALIFYWGMNRNFNDLDMHNIFFSEDYETEFRHLFSLRDFYDDPTVYVFISGKVVPGDAPPGKENWFVMINVPENIGQDWDALIGKYRSAILRKLERMAGLDPERDILFEEVLEPRTIESRTSSFRGSLYGSSSNNRFAAFNRHPNFSGKIKGLYFTGGSVHPGGGIPLCLSSARIVDELIKKPD